ncbi:MAG: hypothetical protein AAFU85_20105 [Planctomycetota bacterium]
MRARSNLLFSLLAFFLLGLAVDASKQGWFDAPALAQQADSAGEDAEEFEVEFDGESGLAVAAACVPAPFARRSGSDQCVSCWERHRVVDQTAPRPPPISAA